MKRKGKGLVFLNPYNPDPPPNYFGPPYGISLIAACLKDSGLKIPITAYDFDLETRSYMLESVRDIMHRDNPLYVAIAAQSCTRGGVYDLIKLVRKIDPRVTIILGGPFATAKYSLLLSKFKIDYVVVGDGEKAMVDLIWCLENGGNPADLKGIAFLRKKKLLFKGEAEKVTNFDTLPYPAFHLFKDFDKKINSTPSSLNVPQFILGRRCTTLKNALLMLSSRGCIYSCNFCPMSKVKRCKIRFHSPEYFVNMVAHFYQKYLIKDFVFGDNFFTLIRERVIKICELIREKELKIKWSCMTRSDYIDQKLLEAMAAAGCFEISYGVESGSSRIQEKIGKKLDLEKTREAFYYTKKSGIRSILMLMVGNTGERLSTVKETAAYVRGIDPDVVLVKRVKVYPGTLIHDSYEEKGLLEKNYYLKSKPIPPLFTSEKTESQINKFSQMLRKKRIFIEVNNICNNNCYGCAANKKNLTKKTEELKESLILASSRADDLFLYGGEIFLRKDIFSILDFAEKLDIHKLSLLSNARLFSYPSFLEKIKKYNFWENLIVPVFGTSKVHDQSTRVEGAFCQTEKGIENIKKGFKSIRIVSNVYITKNNYNFLQEIVERLLSLGVDGFRFIFFKDSLELVQIPSSGLPQMSRVFSCLEKVAGILQRQKVDYFFEGFPVCLLKDKFLTVSELSFPFDEVISYRRGLFKCTQVRAANKAKLDFCSDCRENELCEGVWKDYLKKYKAEEFRCL